MEKRKIEEMGIKVQKEIHVESKKERIKEITSSPFNRRPTACIPGGDPCMLSGVGGVGLGLGEGAGLGLGCYPQVNKSKQVQVVVTWGPL